MKAVIYSRVSTAQQETANQIETNLDYKSDDLLVSELNNSSFCYFQFALLVNVEVKLVISRLASF